MLRAVEAYLDGELPTEQARAVAGHLRDCWACSSRAETHRLVHAVLRRRATADSDALAPVRLRRYARHLGDPASIERGVAVTNSTFGVLAHRTRPTPAPTVTVSRPSGALVRRTPMTTSASTSGAVAARSTLVPHLTAGVAGGVVGGIVFGMLMQMMGMIGMVAMLVGSKSTAVGWVVHLLISAAIGGGFGLVGGRFLARTPVAVGAGLVYGAIWWVLGPLVLMPAKLGMPLFHVDAMAGKSLMGHMIFGVVLGAVAAMLARRSVAR